MTGRNLAKVEAAMNDLTKAGGIKGGLSALQLDVTDSDSIDRAVQKVDEQFGRLDVLINNAGFIPREGTLQEQIQAIMLANAAGPAIVADKFHPLLLKSSNAYSLFVSSGLGSLGMAADFNHPMSQSPWLTYRMSKAALDMLAIQEHRLKSKEGIKVFAVCPGLVRSNLRGTSESQVNAGGRAGDPDVSGRTMLSIINGSRDDDVGKFVHKDGVYPW